ncbi:MAG: substrate-binding domain-containing protein [Lachnospiraceae bacterium]|nr:substrate-binding domain-containing protein [Lachnospiraceae bacterium]
MRKVLKNKNLIILIAVLFVFLGITLSSIYSNSPGKESRKKVSLIVYGDDSERWENMRQGAGLVCEENDADLALITMLTENDVKEQEEIISREISNGADALIIAACSSKEIKEYINGLRVGIPVIFVGSDSESDNKTEYIAPDDYKIGYDLGKQFVKNESDIVTVAIVSENTERDSVALREKGFRDAIATEGKVGKVLTWSRNDNEKTVNRRIFVQRALVSEACDAIVTFDNSATDALLDALVNLNQHSKVYSVSTSNKAVYNLYDKEIRALAYPDEYSMGYLAAMYALDKKNAGRKYSGEEIDYKIVRKENMYDEDNQTLLFPFVN